MLNRRKFVIASLSLVASMPSVVHAGLFGSVGKAFSGGFKKLSKWACKAASFARKVIKAVRHAVAEVVMKVAPEKWYFSTPHTIAVGLEFGDADPVYLINGVNTDYETARKNALVLAAVLRRPVSAIHNPTGKPIRGAADGALAGAAIGGPIGALVGWTAGCLLGGKTADFLECVADAIWTPPLPQHSRAARMVAHLIKNARGRLSIVTHSQGCIQVLNAALTVDAYGYGRKLKQIRWVVTGFDLGRLVDVQGTLNEVHWTPLCRDNDPIVMLSRGYAVPGLYPGILVSGMLEPHTFAWYRHERSKALTDLRGRPEFDEKGQAIPDTERGYASQVKNSWLWPVEPPSQMRHPFRERTIEITNLTRHVAIVRWQPFRETPRISRLISVSEGATVTQQIPPNTTASLKINPSGDPTPASHIALTVEYGEKIDGFGSPEQPLRIAESYQAGTMEVFPIVLEDDTSVPQNYTTPFATTHRQGRETLWMGVQDEWAFTYNEEGEPGVFKGSPLPASHRAIRDHFCYIDLLAQDESVVLVPKSGTGPVMRVFPDGKELGDCYIERYDPDRWPDDWNPIEGIGLGGGGELHGYVMGVTSADYARGTMIVSVVPGGPASRANLRKGDVMVAINGQSIRSARDAEQQVFALQGKTVDIELLVVQSANVTIDAAAPFLRIELQPGTMVVARIFPNSICRQMIDPSGARIELAPGDQLVALGGSFLLGPGDLRPAVLANAGRSVELRYLRPPIATRNVQVALNRVR